MTVLYRLSEQNMAPLKVPAGGVSIAGRHIRHTAPFASCQVGVPALAKRALVKKGFGGLPDAEFDARDQARTYPRVRSGRL